MVTIVTNPEPGQPLLNLLVDLLEPETEVHEAADPLLGVGLALVVTATDRVLVTASSDVDRAQATELLEQTVRTDATYLVLPSRSAHLLAALRRRVNPVAGARRAH